MQALHIGRRDHALWYEEVVVLGCNYPAVADHKQLMAAEATHALGVSVVIGVENDGGPSGHGGGRCLAVHTSFWRSVPSTDRHQLDGQPSRRPDQRRHGLASSTVQCSSRPGTALALAAGGHLLRPPAGSWRDLSPVSAAGSYPSATG